MSGETVHKHGNDDTVRELHDIDRRCCRCKVTSTDFRLTCSQIGDVSSCQDGVSFLIYFIYRFVIAGYFLGFLIFFTVVHARGVKFLIYLTNWSYMLVTVYLCTAATNVLINVVLDRKGMDRLRSQDTFHRVRHQVQWLLFYMSITASVIVTLIYWLILHPVIPEDQKLPLYIAINMHLFPVVFCLLDLFITKVTFGFLHVIYPFFYLISYALFSVIYWAADGTDPYGDPYIYPILDYENEPGIAVASLLGIAIAVFPVHGMLKMLYYLRMRYVDRHVKNSMDDERVPLNPQEPQKKKCGCC